jgi:anthranilate synthase/phosphoribosyltransferase
LRKRVIVIDNYDSFVYNIVQCIGEVEKSSEILVFRNDKTTIEELENLNPTHLIISPGPGRPENAGISVDVVKNFFDKVPILGVCLGHQVIGYAFGGKITGAKKIFHGKTSRIFHSKSEIFKNVKNPFVATRYHSLVVSDVPPQLNVIARSDDGEVMAIKHVESPVFGVQFHPESFLTAEGKKIIENFLNISESRKNEPVVIDEDVFKSVMQKLLSREDLTFEETRQIMEKIMSGELDDAQIAGFLVALRAKGETGEELAGMAKVMQEKSLKVRTFSSKTVDTCGTGGDGAGTFNISTLTAFVVCSGGIPVAKHGNRSVSSKVGSADVLEAGGYILDKKIEEVERELKDTGFSFLFAPKFHPAMKHVMPSRRQLKIRTAFNLLGPLTNPAGVKHQIIGVFNFDSAMKISTALHKLGTRKSVVLSGGFTDEITTCDENKALLITTDEITPLDIDIEKLGLKKGEIEELKGPDNPQEAFDLMKKILKGDGTRTQIETVSLNAGIVFWIVEDVDSLKTGVEKAIDLILSGKALKKLEEVIRYQQTFKSS